MSQRQKGVQRMISEKLKYRLVYVERPASRFDAEGKALINKAVRKLVLLMRSLEVHGLMTREQIENCVLEAFENAEYLYYGLGEHELMMIVDKEIANDKGRRRNSKSL